MSDQPTGQPAEPAPPTTPEAFDRIVLGNAYALVMNNGDPWTRHYQRLALLALLSVLKGPLGAKTLRSPDTRAEMTAAAERLMDRVSAGEALPRPEIVH